MRKKRQVKITPANRRAFTLLEILLVIGIIATLAVVVIVALDPAKRFEDAKNSRRLSDIQSILSAVRQYMVDNKGATPSGLDANEKQIGAADNGCELSNSICSVNTSRCLNLSSDLAKYLKEIPYDPDKGSAAKTRYSIAIDSNNIITVKACESTDAAISYVSR